MRKKKMLLSSSRLSHRTFKQHLSDIMQTLLCAANESDHMFRVTILSIDKVLVYNDEDLEVDAVTDIKIFYFE